ncbi:MAG: FAD-dependent oxidoreductase [Chloroflexi bacterium]|nr:FAD-dependent oxidoreductase [Chloroflexota bacterium]
MSQQFKYLFTPLKIGSITVRNRIFQASHNKVYGDYGDNICLASEKDAYYQAERAKGGAGLLVLDDQMVHPTSTGGRFRHQAGFEKAQVPRYRRIADMVHQNGGAIFAQVGHHGIVSNGEQIDDYHEVWAPSAVPNLAGITYGKVPKAMEVSEIQEVLKGFALTASHVKEGGMDGVEIHAGHGYLLNQFMSPLTNKRNDGYGGSPEKRMRFVLEVIEAVRGAVGKDYTVGIRISADEFCPGGLVLEETKKIAKILEETNKLDFIDVSGGTPWCVTGIVTIFPMSIPPGLYLHLAAGIKEVVQSIPVFCIGPRITDPVMAEQILANGQADMVGMVRALICDPELPNKAREGRLDDIRRCMGCCQGCSQKQHSNLPVGCVQTPATGREKRLGIGTLKPAEKSKKVVIIGGGPAGLKAAEISARQGHKVVLFEREPELGGQVRLAAKTPTREEFGEVIRYLSYQVKRLGVDIKPGVEANLDTVRAEKPDAVIVATGIKAAPYTAWSHTQRLEQSIPGADGKNVVSGWDVLNEKAQAGQKVVVLDDEGHQRGISVAQWLADKGKEVHLVTHHPTIGMRIYHGSDPYFRKRLAEKGIKVTVNAEIKEIAGNAAIFKDTATGAEKRIEGVDTVVWMLCEKPDDDLYFKLKGQFPDVRRIGDCVAPRFVEYAIWEGEDVGRAL